MAKSLSIKGVPDELLKRLRERAEGHHRSLQGELLSILEESLGPRKITIQELRESARALGLRTPDEATKWIREDRDHGH
ncbi:MAG: Arc family DNA-binding protein [Chloroflexi bacterium]|nr:Arc family DNA-binding protein [Chloroflexota bacterium]